MSKNESQIRNCSPATFSFIIDQYSLVRSLESRPRGLFLWYLQMNSITLKFTFNFEWSLWLTGWLINFESKLLSENYRKILFAITQTYSARNLVIWP